MNEARRQAYLEAMGFDVWLARPAAPEACRLRCASERTDDAKILAICEREDQAGTRMAQDIARAFNDELAWAWPETGPVSDSSGESFGLAELVDEKLYTGVVIFGRELPRLLGCKAGAGIVGSARVQVATSLDELEVSPAARREFWETVLRPIVC